MGWCGRLSVLLFGHRMLKESRVVGDFNHWEEGNHVLKRVTNEGLWVGFFTDIPVGSAYKYKINSSNEHAAIKGRSLCISIRASPSNSIINTS